MYAANGELAPNPPSVPPIAARRFDEKCRLFVVRLASHGNHPRKRTGRNGETRPRGPVQAPDPLVATALVSAGAVGAAVYFLASRPGAAHRAEAAPPAVAPIFFALEPFTVNLQSDDGAQHYLRIDLSLKLSAVSPLHCWRYSSRQNGRTTGCTGRLPWLD
jgi:hypothetical protein